MRGPPPYCPSPPIPFPQVGVLVAKTLSNASANPFIASAAGVYNPVLALDVFLVQVRGGGCCWGDVGGACAEEVAVGMYKPVLLTVTVPRLAPPPPSGPPPPLPLQAATNTLLGHFLSLVCSLWLLNIVGEGRGLRFQV